MHKITFKCIFLIFFLSPIVAENRGADNAAPFIARTLESFNIPLNSVYIFSEIETATLTSLAATLEINVFELIDCVYRHILSTGNRFVLTGVNLRKTEKDYSLGDERVLAILPISKLNKIEMGAKFDTNQNAVDIYLDSEYQSFIEIGTAHYERQFGFESMSPLLFDKCYGVQVSKFFFNSPLIKLELYAPAKGAIYVKNVPRPKRWNLQVILEK